MSKRTWLIVERGKKGLTQGQAAKEMGMSRNTYNRLERGTLKNPFVSTIARLAEFYGFEIKEWFEHEA